MDSGATGDSAPARDTGPDLDATVDSGAETDAGGDAAPDSGVAADASTDAALDASWDANSDSGAVLDAAADAEMDTGAASDARVDAVMDTGTAMDTSTPADTGPADTGPPPVTCTEPGLTTRVITDSASSGTPDSYFIDVNPGDPFCAEITGGGGGTWGVTVSNGTSTGVYCRNVTPCHIRIPAGVPTVIATAQTTDIGGYTLTLRYVPR